MLKLYRIEFTIKGKIDVAYIIATDSVQALEKMRKFFRGSRINKWKEIRNTYEQR